MAARAPRLHSKVATDRPSGTRGTSFATEQAERVTAMNLKEAIQRRRAVRDFADKQVDEPTIRSLLSAAVQAPSAMNVQPWAFAIIQNTGQLKRYSDRAKQLLLRATEKDAKVQSYRELLENETFNIFHNASTLVVIGALEVGIYTAADCWLAAENLMLAATDAGLGTCCIGFAVPLLNTPEVKAELGFGAAGEVFAPIVVGYPTSPVSPVPRKEPKVISWMR